MANSKYEYVKEYEEASEPILLKNCYVVVRVDGRGFHKFSKAHKFVKPNDKRALDLMTRSAKFVMNEFFPDITMAYDEYSFIFRRCASVFNRRANKISTLVASAFAAAFVFHWPKFFEPSRPLLYPPSFDARCVMYPNKEVLVDYMRWRQVDCHINNLYNTTFYALTGEYTRYNLDGDDVKLTPLPDFCKDPPKPLTNQEAEKRLCGSVSSDKNEILFSEYGINYNNEWEQFKKGTLIALAEEHLVNLNSPQKHIESKKSKEEQKLSKTSYRERDINFRVLNQDIIKDQFWVDNSYLIDS